jgi:uncharacterized protein (TIGR03435 family)
MLRSTSLIAFVAVLSAQQPRFEVASVKPVSADVRMGYSGDTERMTWARIPLTNLIADAYNVGLDRITGPDWLRSEFYAINIKLPPGSTKEQYPEMMVDLLAERFGLVAHRVTKEVSGYEITAAQVGPKLNPSGPESLSARIPFASRIEDDMDRMTFKGSTIAFLASRLQAVLSRNREAGRLIPVTDATGIKGRFDFQLTIPASTATDPEINAGDVSSALENQLGLKLKAVKTTVDFIVVDHVNRVPTEN